MVPAIKRNVDLPLGKARHLDRKYIDPVIEVGPKGTVIDTRLDILMSGADKAKIDFDLVISANPLNAAVLQNTQQLCLQR